MAALLQSAVRMLDLVFVRWITQKILDVIIVSTSDHFSKINKLHPGQGKEGPTLSVSTDVS